MTDDSFGHRVRRRREARGLSQEQLASRAGVTRQMISYYEANKYEPDKETRPKLARALECQEADLFPGAESAPEPIVGNHQNNPDYSLLEWTDLYARSRPEHIKIAKTFLEVKAREHAKIESRGGAAAPGLPDDESGGSAKHPPAHHDHRGGVRKRNRH